MADGRAVTRSGMQSPSIPVLHGQLLRLNFGIFLNAIWKRSVSIRRPRCICVAVSKASPSSNSALKVPDRGRQPLIGVKCELERWVKPRDRRGNPRILSGKSSGRNAEIRGISVEEIAGATKIRKGFLEALERNEFTALPAPAFTRGFVRAYARYLGLNPEEMVDRYIFFERSAREGINEMPTPLISNDSAALQKLRESRDRTRRTTIILIVVGILAVAAVAIWFFMFRSPRSIEPRTRTNVPSASPPAAKTPSTGGSTVAPSVSPTSSPAPSVASTAPMTLTLKAIENTWVDLQSEAGQC